MSRKTRTFLALPIPAAICDRLEQIQRKLAADLPGCRWVEPRLFHLTLAFLGDVDDVDLHALCRAVREAVAPVYPITLAVGGLVVFPDVKQPRVVAAGLDGDLEGLEELRRIVCAACRAQGYRPDDRFHPHVTLGRPKLSRGDEIDASSLIARFRRSKIGIVLADQVVAFASITSAEGVDYTALDRAPLLGGQAPKPEIRPEIDA